MNRSHPVSVQHPKHTTPTRQNVMFGADRQDNELKNPAFISGA